MKRSELGGLLCAVISWSAAPCELGPLASMHWEGEALGHFCFGVTECDFMSEVFHGKQESGLIPRFQY